MKNILLIFFLITKISFLSGTTSEVYRFTLGEYVLKEKTLKETLDRIFHSPHVLDSQASLNEAGFITLHIQPTGMRVLKHPLLPKYLIKAYLNHETIENRSIDWLINRCAGAGNIRNLIKKKSLRHFTVPDKWIYFLNGPFVNENMHDGVLVVTHMPILPFEDSSWAWKNIAGEEQLRELYCILGNGFASCFLSANIPYTTGGNFACIDTEYPKRKLPLDRVKKYFRPEMQAYWDKLLKKKKKVK